MDKHDVVVDRGTGTAPGQHLDQASEDWLSALFDGELDDGAAGQAIGRFGREPAATRRWAEYSLIGDVMRGCGGDPEGLTARMRAALAAEPTILAPLPAAKPQRQPYYWLAAAAAVTAITWGLWQVVPTPGPDLPMAANPKPSAPVQGGVVAANEAMPSQVMSYLAAHQDYAYAVVSEPEMRFTQVSLAGDAR